MDDPVLVSVLVPVLNEQAHIRQAVASMRAQELDGRLELLFMDGRSEDATREILEELAEQDPRIRVLDNPGRITPKGLNVGLRAARGEFVARMDAHALYPPTYLASAVERLRQGDVAWVCGPQLPHGEGVWSRRVAMATRSWAGVGGSKMRLGAEAEIEVDTGFTGAWRRSTLEALGGWDEGWPINQDSELAGRIRAAGGRIVNLPEMAARYIPRDSLKALARQYGRYGLYRAKTARRHPHTLRRSHLLLVALPLGALVAALGPRALARPARAGSGLYALALGAASAGQAHRGALRDAATLPVVFATMHFAWGTGFLLGALRFGPPLRALARALGLGPWSAVG